MAKTHIERTLAELAGNFLVAGQLCLRGYVASLASKNYPEIDIFYFNPKNRKHAAIQVQTIRDDNSYFISEDVDKSKHLFVFVRINSDESVEFYVVPAKDVATLSAKEREDYLREHRNVKKEQPRMVGIGKLALYKDRWELLAGK